MADDKRGRDKQGRDQDRRQRERDVLAELNRMDETDPTVDDADLDELETELEAKEFPMTGAEIVSVVGDRMVDALDGPHTVAELVPDTGEVIFDSPTAVRMRVERPTVAAAMKRIFEASDTLPRTSLGGSQRDAYEKTLRALKAVDADDDDEGVRVITDWIVEYISEKNSLPGSRAVRREAAKFCRANGYEVRNDEWLGI